MKFINRLKYYAVGLGLGILISYFFFGNRSCSGWLPGNRVKSAMLDFPFVTSKKMDCIMQQNNLTLDSLARFVSLASINFNQSETEVTPRVYHLSHNQQILKMGVNFIDSTIFLKEIVDLKVPNCKTLPNRFIEATDTTLRGFDELKTGEIARQNILNFTFISSEKTTCMLSTNNFDYPLLADFIQKAAINIQKSELDKIQSEYYISLGQHTAKVVVNHKKEETYVKAFYGRNSTLPCDNKVNAELKKMDKTLKDYL